MLAREEVRPPVQVGRLYAELREDGRYVRAVVGAVVDRLQQEQRDGHRPGAGRIVAGHLDLAVGLRSRRFFQLRVAEREPLLEHIETGEGVRQQWIRTRNVEQPGGI